MFCYEDKTAYRIYISNQHFEKHVYLLLFLNSKSFHYVLIKNFGRFMTDKTKDHGKKHFSRFCLQCFSGSKLVECRTKSSLPISHTKSVLLPEKGT